MEDSRIRAASKKTGSFLRSNAVLWLLFALFLGMRILNLSADPPDNISPDSCGEYGDPGNYAFNARSKIVLGDWKIDELGAAPFTPIAHFLTYGVFRLLGPGIAQMNAVPVVFAALLWLALALLATRFFPKARLLFFLLLALNYPLGIFSRINDQIMPMTFFAVLALYFYLRAWERPRDFAWTGVCLWLSLVSKAKIVYFPIAVLPLATIIILVTRGELRKIKLNLIRLAYLAAGVLPVALAWLFFVYLKYTKPFKIVASLNAEYMLPGVVGQALTNWLRKPPFSFHPTNQVLTFLLFFYLFLAIIVWAGRRAKLSLSALEIVCLIWLAVGLGSNSFIGYRPIRHYIEFTIPMLVLASRFLVRLASGLKLNFHVGRPAVFFAAAGPFLWVSLSGPIRRILIRGGVESDERFFILIATMVAAAVLAAILAVVFRLRRLDREIVLPRKPAWALAAALILVYCGQNISEYVRWAAHPTFNLKTVGRDLGAAFPDGVFAGLLTPSLSLENRNPAHTSFPAYANDDPEFLERVKATHLFIGLFNQELSNYYRYYPKEMDRAVPVARFWIWRSWFVLFDIRPGAQSARDPGVREAEALERNIGHPRFDGEASGKFSVLARTAEKGIIGRERVSLPGQTRITGGLYVRPAPNEGNGGENLRLSVRIILRKFAYFDRTFTLSASESGSGYKKIPFEFYLPEDGTYTLLVRSDGGRAYFLDKIELRPES